MRFRAEQAGEVALEFAAEGGGSDAVVVRIVPEHL
jgi:hypothetical protein